MTDDNEKWVAPRPTDIIHDETIDIKIQGKIYTCGPIYWRNVDETRKLQAEHRDWSGMLLEISSALSNDYPQVTYEWLTKRVTMKQIKDWGAKDGIYRRLLEISGYDVADDNEEEKEPGEATSQESLGNDSDGNFSQPVQQEDSSGDHGMNAAAE